MTNEELDRYFSQIREKYNTSSENLRTAILGKLEKLIKREIFDREKAKQIRLDSGLSLRDLGGELTPEKKKSTSSLLLQYERGVRNPRGANKGRTTTKYLLWLKAHGYNPYIL